MPNRYEVSVIDGQIELPAEVIELFNKVRILDEAIKDLKRDKDSIEKPLKDAMKKYGVDKFSCEYMTATTVKDSMVETVNTERMKDDGIYDKYKMYVPKSGYVTIRYKKERDHE